MTLRKSFMRAMIVIQGLAFVNAGVRAALVAERFWAACARNAIFPMFGMKTMDMNLIGKD